MSRSLAAMDDLGLVADRDRVSVGDRDQLRGLHRYGLALALVQEMSRLALPTRPLPCSLIVWL
jgi:hypothetical protein